MKKRAIFKILFLLHLIFSKNVTKKEIIDEFEKLNIHISPNLIANYIKKLINAGFEIEILKDKSSLKENIYKIQKPQASFNFSNSQLDLLNEIKMLIIAQKDFRYIATLWELFLKVSDYIIDEEQKEKFLNFGYFSNLNWELVKSLKKHCEKKSLLELDYLLPQEGNKIIEYQAYSLELGDLSQRLYLIGRLKNAKDLFRLPVDRIYRIKKVIENTQDTTYQEEIFEYKILKENIEYIELKENEKIISQDKSYITIRAINSDDFKTIQRLEYFCPDLCYVSDERIKNLLLDKLKKMEKLYD